MGERRERIVERLVGDVPELADRLCEVCAEVTGVSVAGIVLMSEDVSRVSVCTNGDVGAVVDHLQCALGEGPWVDAYRYDRPVFAPDLADPSTPWPAFAGPAVDAGVRAAFSFPVRVGAVRLGTLNLYSDRPGPLTDEQRADAIVMADVAAEAILLMEANAPSTKLASEFADGADFQNVVNQASGMIAAQLDIRVGQALVRLRMYAFGNDRRVGDVARDVVARKLRVGTHSNDDDTRLNRVSRDVAAAGIRHVVEKQDASHNGGQGIP